MAGTGISEGLIGMDAQSGWQLMSGSQLGSQLELSVETFTRAYTCGLSFLQNSSWDPRGSILGNVGLFYMLFMNYASQNITCTNSVGQASHWSQSTFKRRVIKLYLLMGSGKFTL